MNQTKIKDADMVECQRLDAEASVVKPVSFEPFAMAVQEPEVCWLLLNRPPIVG